MLAAFRAFLVKSASAIADVAEVHDVLVCFTVLINVEMLVRVKISVTREGAEIDVEHVRAVICASMVDLVASYLRVLDDATIPILGMRSRNGVRSLSPDPNRTILR